jgi:uncharacterized protein (UPF0212 family)
MGINAPSRLAWPAAPLQNAGEESRMSDTIRFKYRELDANGNQAGFLAKKGHIEGDLLTLADTEIPLLAVRKAIRRFDRLVLEIMLADQDEPLVVVLAISSGKPERIAQAINLRSSRRWAELRQEALSEQGRGAEFRSQECPACGATVDCSGHPASPQLYCSYCDSILTIADSRPAGEEQMHCCDNCGMYAKPRPFTVFYFYFLLYIWGYRYQRLHLCHTCMRPKAWKMLFGNLLFILGVPVALTQLVRAYATGSVGSPAFAGLDAANALAKRKRIGPAIEKYELIYQRLASGAAGVRYNIGLAEMSRGNWEGAMQAFEAGLAECSNHQRTAQMLAQVYTAAKRPDKLAALKAAWGVQDEPEVDDAVEAAEMQEA